MVVAVAEFELLILGVDSRADFRQLGEVKRCALDRTPLARRNQALVHRQEMVRGEHQLVVQNRVLRVAGQIPVRVMAEVDDRRLVRCGFKLDAKLVFVGQPVGDRGLQIAGIPFFAIRAEIAELDPHGSRLLDRIGIPEHFVKALDAAVESVLAIVLR